MYRTYKVVSMTSWENKKILVTGGAGFLGSNVVKHLLASGAKQGNIIVPRSRDIDLRVWENCLSITKGVDLIIHLAASVGGIGYNMNNPGSLFYDNAIMGIQLMEAARQNNVGKFVAVGTICAYPKFTPIPFREEELWNGYPEETNAPYGLAKKTILVQARHTVSSTVQCDLSSAGESVWSGDNFNPDSSHVIPALIKKFIDAKESGSDRVEVWGTGAASREFLYVDDAARGIVRAAESYDKPDPVNLGAGMEITIRDLVDLISELTGFEGEIVWDVSKPDGQPRRMLDVSVAEREFGFRAKVEFREGLKKTIEWYVTQK